MNRRWLPTAALAATSVVCRICCRHCRFRCHTVIVVCSGFSTTPSIYTAINSTPRFIRLKPDAEACVEEVEAEVNYKLERVEWLQGFYSLPPHIQIAGSRAYQEGKIYGIDESSGAAVMALNVSPGDYVVDLCAAPGAKLCMILHLLGDLGL